VVLVVALAGILLGGLASRASAIPSLQLDILGGVYDGATQTIVATSDSFRLYAYLIPAAGSLLGDNYFISAAVVPRTGPAGATLGSFTFNGATINVTQDMVYGVPPIEALQSHDPGDLPRHGIFETYFSEFAFRFSSTDRASAYNTQDQPGQGPTPNPAGSMYFVGFDVDVAALADTYSIHFDLYNELYKTSRTCTGTGADKVCTSTLTGDVDVNTFAPFSHDAQSGSRREVPEATSLALTGLGLVMAGLVIRRFGSRRTACDGGA
jgi:hypothetical protein